ncbi:MAG: hypothetical protein JEZ06_00500 [Anaerolineaceae bacterium]|nr:hypothetical protein [Anaerolineaceae bacterium]
MATLAQLVVKLITDTTEFSKGMEKASKRLSSFGSEMNNLGNKMTMGVTVPLALAGGAAIKFASDLEETRNKSDVVFGEMTDQVRAWSDQSIDLMGMSENSALSYASTYGSILKNMGMAAEETSDMSMSLTQLTADYASFHNLEPGAAFEKIKAGMVGSSEPLIGLGKDLRVAAVEQYAFSNGIASVGEKLDNQQLALARYGQLLSQSGDEMGDFVRTSDGLANSSRTFKEQLEDTMASFGEILIPTVTSFLQAATPILKWLNDLPEGAKKGIVNMLLFAAALGPVIKGIGLISMGAGKIAGLFGTGGTLASVGTWFSGLAGSVSGATGALSGMLGAAGAVLGPVLALVAAVGGLIIVIKLFGAEAWESVKMLSVIVPTLVTDLINNVGKWFKNVGLAIVEGIGEGITAGWDWLVNLVQQTAQYLLEAAERALGIASPSRMMAGIGANMMLGLAQGIEGFQFAPVNATVNAVGATVPAAAGVRSGGGRSVSMGDIHIYGDLSESAREDLRKEVRKIFSEEMEGALDE